MRSVQDTQHQDAVQQREPGNPRDALCESLSALMDNEADSLELRRVLRALPGDPELAAIWRRYHVVRAGLHHDMHPRPKVNLLAAVQARLAAEDVPVTGWRRRIGAPLMVRLGQGAIAASVALAVLVGVSSLSISGSDQRGAALVADDNTTQVLPLLGSEFNAEELARNAVTRELDDVERSRIEQAVLRELSNTPEAEQIPVRYNPEFPE